MHKRKHVEIYQPPKVGDCVARSTFNDHYVEQITADKSLRIICATETRDAALKIAELCNTARDVAADHCGIRSKSIFVGGDAERWALSIIVRSVAKAIGHDGVHDHDWVAGKDEPAPVVKDQGTST